MLEPIGDERLDFLAASMCSLISNIARQLFGEKGVTMTTPLDFIPRWGGETAEKKTQPDKSEQTLDEMKEIITSIAKQASGRMTKKGRRRRH